MGWARRDARDWQILALGSLILTSLLAFDFGVTLPAVGAALASAVTVQALGNRLVGRAAWDIKSALITGCSLSLLLRVETLWLYPLAAAIGIGTKFLIRLDGAHLFNPAALGIAITTALFPAAWIAPAQWGTLAWVLALVGLLGVAVLSQARRGDITLAFLLAFAGILFGRALWLGDPLAIPLHALQSGALLIFACFMISDPRTTPRHAIARLIFAFCVAALAVALLVEAHWRTGLIWALVFAAPLVPILNRLFPAPAHSWKERENDPDIDAVGDPAGAAHPQPARG